MKTKTLLTFLLLSICASMQAQDTTYDWTGGATGFSGKIVMDSPSSPVGGGSASDIVSIEITTPLYGQLDMVLGSETFEDPIFTWDSSQITEMSIFGGDTTPHTLGLHMFVAEDSPDMDGGIGEMYAVNDYTLIYGQDESGSWLAAPSVGVPDAGGSGWLLGLALAGLGSLKRSKIFTSSLAPFVSKT